MCCGQTTFALESDYIAPRSGRRGTGLRFLGLHDHLVHAILRVGKAHAEGTRRAPDQADDLLVRHALAPLPGQTLWDLGAGCASVAIEWLRAAQDIQGQGATAIAVERNAERCAMAARNAARLGTPFLEILHDEWPSALPALAEPDAVFIGGGLSEDAALIDRVWQRLGAGGRLAANVVTLEGERALLDAQARLGGELTRIAVSHAEPVGSLTGWRPAMPVTQWSATKP